MKKLNKKGFALVETLIVSVFVATMFTVLYTNFLPMMGEYERRENYDDIESVYNTYLIKRMIEIDKGKIGQIIQYYYDEHYFTFNCDVYDKNSDINLYCQNLISEADIEKVYFMDYNLNIIKQSIKNNIAFADDPETAEYIKTLPYFTNTANKPKYRIVVKYSKTINNAISDEDNKKTIYSFSTIGVDI